MKTVRLPKSRTKASLPEKGFAPRNLLVPVDFSSLSEKGLQRAQQIARQFGSKIQLLHVVEPVINPAEFAIVPREMEEVNTQIMSERRTRLEAIHTTLTHQGVSSRTEVRLGKPWRVITDYAKRAKCDLIVIATHGLTGAKHLLVGSTTERVVQHAPCSVLVVR